jgi:hypothetical protein
MVAAVIDGAEALAWTRLVIGAIVLLAGVVIGLWISLMRPSQAVKSKLDEAKKELDDGKEKVDEAKARAQVSDLGLVLSTPNGVRTRVSTLRGGSGPFRRIAPSAFPQARVGALVLPVPFRPSNSVEWIGKEIGTRKRRPPWSKTTMISQTSAFDRRFPS